jgi:hypothetical protein
MAASSPIQEITSHQALLYLLQLDDPEGRRP